jgi:hypothetical protein
MNASQVAENYALRFKILKAEWYYSEPQGQAGQGLLAAAAAAREALQRLSFAEITALEDRRSFWINVYNGGVIDLAISAGVRHSVKEIGRFFVVKHLNIGGVPLSFDDIEHGLLRANRRHPAGLLPPLLCRPPLKAWMVHRFDPRIHFALNCGGRSCPPIAVYKETQIDNQLETAATAFLSTEVEIDPQGLTIRANPMLRWYRSDFAELGGLEELIRRYRPGELDERNWRFEWKKYDWSL